MKEKSVLTQLILLKADSHLYTSTGRAWCTVTTTSVEGFKQGAKERILILHSAKLMHVNWVKLRGRHLHLFIRNIGAMTLLLTQSRTSTLAIRAKGARLKFLHQIIHKQLKLDASKYTTFHQSRIARCNRSCTLKELFCSNDTLRFSFFLCCPLVE